MAASCRAARHRRNWIDGHAFRLYARGQRGWWFAERKVDNLTTRLRHLGQRQATHDMASADLRAAIGADYECACHRVTLREPAKAGMRYGSIQLRQHRVVALGFGNHTKDILRGFQITFHMLILVGIGGIKPRPGQEAAGQH